METKSKEETERIIRMLRTALRLLGFTNREIERRLGYTPSYLTRLFSGQIELRFEHVVEIASAIGMTAEEFFQFAYPVRASERSEQAMRLNEILEELRPTTRRYPFDADPEKLEKLYRQNKELADIRMREELEREIEERIERDRAKEREIEERTERDREKRRERRAAKKSAAAGAKPSAEGSGKSRSA
jgi:transcriptional regulator with XRE-family HTH domain